MKRSLLNPLVIIGAALIGFIIYLSLPSEGNDKKRRSAVVPVNIAKAEMKSFRDVIEALGTAKANESVTVTSTMSDIVDQVYFVDGQQVEKGTPLISLKSREEKARISELEAKLNEAKRQLNRLRGLQREEATSEQLLDEQTGEVKTVKAQLEVAKTRLDEMSILAPFSGVLGIRQVSPGALLKSGEAITTLDDISKIKVDFSVSEAFLPLISTGQKVVAASVAYSGKSFEGEIVAIDSRIDPVTRAVQVRAIIDNSEKELRAGMLLKIELEKSVDDIILMPEGALIPIQERQYVYVIDSENKAQRKEVEIGRRRPGEVEILSGLSLGEKVVIQGALRLSPGASAKILGDN